MSGAVVVTYHCPVCVLDWDENFCGVCGREDLNDRREDVAREDAPATEGTVN